MSQAALTDRLPAANVLRILAVLLIIAGPHLTRLPLWSALLVLAVGGWRAAAALRTWSMPPLLLRLPLAALACVGVYLHYGTFNGQYAGAALLVVMLAMKLTEMTTRRDYLLVIYLSYFLLITHFLFNEELYTLVFMLVGAWLVTFVLVDVNHPHAVLPLRRALRQSGIIVAQAIPLMVLLFLLFPRIPGPLWGLPSQSGLGKSGLSESMEPGAISALSLSDAVAFRARFLDNPPSREKLYWRGPVFQFFNGRQWLPGPIANYARPIEITYGRDVTRYQLQLEPHGNHWLLALDLPIPELPERSRLGSDLVLYHRESVSEKRLYELRSATEYRVDLDLDQLARRANLALPQGTHPRARELAQRWRAQWDDPRQIRDAALQMYRDQAFTYTLEPPALRGTDPMDQFLFETRRGFCEHFASSFTILMRAAGVPARVVTGYQGGDPNGDYLIIRQADAHAWSEIWVADEGWIRVDPTGAVAPNRISLGLGAALPFGEPVPGLARLNRNLLGLLELRWDLVNAAWNRWVLAYGPDLQEALLSALGFPGMRSAIILLTIGIVLSLSILALWLAYKQRPLADLEPAQRLWRRFLRKLQRAGFRPNAAEGPADLERRIAQQRPEWAGTSREITRLYIRLRYAGGHDPQLLDRLAQRVRSFPRAP